MVREAFGHLEIPYVEGLIWSTDAIYRETSSKVLFYRQKDVVAVEMELSALLTVGLFRQARVGSVLVVSDDLSTFKWRPGFRNENFKRSRKKVCEAITELCRK